MITYIIRRLLLMIPTLLGVTIAVFAISRIAPGDPVSLSMGASGQVDAQQAADVRAARMSLYGLDKPVYVQYAGWLGHVVRLDFGDSIKHHRKVLRADQRKTADHAKLESHCSCDCLCGVAAGRNSGGGKARAFFRPGKFGDSAYAVVFAGYVGRPNAHRLFYGADPGGEGVVSAGRIIEQ